MKFSASVRQAEITFAGGICGGRRPRIGPQEPPTWRLVLRREVPAQPRRFDSVEDDGSQFEDDFFLLIIVWRWNVGFPFVSQVL